MQLLSDIIMAYEGSLQAAAVTTKPQQPQLPTSTSAQNGSSEGGAAAGLDGAANMSLAGLDGVLAAVLDPLLEMVKRSAEALSPDSPARLDDGAKLDPTAYKVGAFQLQVHWAVAMCRAVASNKHTLSLPPSFSLSLLLSRSVRLADICAKMDPTANKAGQPR